MVTKGCFSCVWCFLQRDHDQENNKNVCFETMPMIKWQKNDQASQSQLHWHWSFVCEKCAHQVVLKQFITEGHTSLDFKIRDGQNQLQGTWFLHKKEKSQGNANNFDTTVNFCLSNIKISLDRGLFQEKGLLSLRRGVKLKRRRGMWKRPFNHDLKAKLHFAHQEMMMMAAASCKSSMDYSLQLPLASSSNLWRNWIGQCR